MLSETTWLTACRVLWRAQVTWLKQEQMDEVRERLESQGTEWVVTDVESKVARPLSARELDFIHRSRVGGVVGT